jgi:quercetin dioxygenase-like cupin family protein
VSSQIVEDPVFKHRLRFTDATDEQGAPAVRCEMWIEPGGGVPPHAHPSMEERFTVREGRPELLAGRAWAAAEPGETVVVPAGTRHAYRNRGDVEAYLVCIATPPDPGLEGFLSDAARMGRAGMLTKHGLPTSWRALLQAAVMIDHYRDMVVMGFPPLPPKPVQRLLIPPLARLGARRGYRAGTLG